MRVLLGRAPDEKHAGMMSPGQWTEVAKESPGMSREIRFTVPLVVTALISLLAVADGAKRPAARWASYDLPQVATINKRMIASWKEYAKSFLF